MRAPDGKGRPGQGGQNPRQRTGTGADRAYLARKRLLERRFLEALVVGAVELLRQAAQERPAAPRPPDDFLAECPECGATVAVELDRADVRRLAPGPMLWRCPACSFEFLATPDGVAWAG